ncbi:hypothetical protein RAJCM14343_0031 [Rhodococcus aetherivorans]|uniref:GAF and ANTAR domain-containing protein n=1 Tax=Rhodococcus aetherivorans TaxID=191292 RepID=A0A059MR30_9NOCA|nr:MULTISPECIES: GAF and ANTAR domain-containing protein [Rhodococcus]ETT26773.1 ANTAR domain protein with unknown sensor [Rhodococcus rhodochrous ATCC 21198]AKE89570.1 transcriptional regulator [Rhodococcus aetherivorans]ANZ25707.1 transcriptional regulator [Rhodococcus sp. WB1]KDE13659.1 transcriptional regulator [Rhodococcus aetherivorans]MBC2586984.1 GAF and ANTAR domain-containing protein [Rhodococcus aetherivorans]
MFDQDEFMAVLSRFARLLPTPYDVGAALDELVDGVTAVLGLLGCGVSLQCEGRLQFVTAAAEVVGEMERCQEEAGVGPCQYAFDRGEPIAVADVRTRSDLWPDYAEKAREHGIAAVAGIPMQLADEKIGALDLYACEPREWADREIAAAQIFADMATGYIVNSNKLRQHEQLNAQLQAALDSRIVIEQAKGIIAHARSTTPDEAFRLIRGHARSNQAPVRSVAKAIVEVGLRV